MKSKSEIQSGAAIAAIACRIVFRNHLSGSYRESCSFDVPDINQVCSQEIRKVHDIEGVVWRRIIMHTV